MKKYITILLCVAMLPLVIAQRGTPLSGGGSSSSGGGNSFLETQFSTNGSSKVQIMSGATVGDFNSTGTIKTDFLREKTVGGGITLISVGGSIQIDPTATSLDMGSVQIANLPTPTSAANPATKGYVDALVSSQTPYTSTHNAAGNSVTNLNNVTATNTVTGGSVVATGGNVAGTKTNTLNGYNVIATNCAPLQTVLNPFTINVFYTNNTGHRASPFIYYTLTDSSISGSPGILFTNLTTTEYCVFTNSFVLSGASSAGATLPEISTSDIILFTNQSSGSAAAAINASSLKLK